MRGGTCCEFASQMQFARWLFDEILTLMHFVFIFLQKCAPRSSRKQLLENQL